MRKLYSSVYSERFEDEPTDCLVLLFASAIVTRTRHTLLQFRILSALWCFYGHKITEIDPTKHKEMINWFTYSLFGRHATPREVTIWTLRCQMPIPPPEPEQGEGNMVASTLPVVPSALRSLGQPSRGGLFGEMGETLLVTPTLQVVDLADDSDDESLESVQHSPHWGAVELSRQGSFGGVTTSLRQPGSMLNVPQLSIRSRTSAIGEATRSAGGSTLSRWSTVESGAYDSGVNA